MFLDANIFILAYIAKDKKAQACRKFLEGLAKGEQKASTSPLVVDEVLYFFIEHKGLDLALRVFHTITANRNIRMLSVEERTLNSLPIMLKAGLAPRDAFHAATMKANNVETICSFDKGFDGIKGIKRQEPK